jgi:hypothetical protein
MKTLELNQMELVNGGDMDYGDSSCEEFWGSVSIAISGASFYATALFGPVGAIGSFILGAAAGLYSMNCD